MFAVARFALPNRFATIISKNTQCVHCAMTDMTGLSCAARHDATSISMLRRFEMSCVHNTCVSDGMAIRCVFERNLPGSSFIEDMLGCLSGAIVCGGIDNVRSILHTTWKSQELNITYWHNTES